MSTAPPCRYPPNSADRLCGAQPDDERHSYRSPMGSLASHHYMPPESECEDCGKSIFTPSCGPRHDDLAARYDAEYQLPWCIDARGGRMCGLPRPCTAAHDARAMSAFAWKARACLLNHLATHLHADFLALNQDMQEQTEYLISRFRDEAVACTQKAESNAAERAIL